jgi:hypothetical protein
MAVCIADLDRMSAWRRNLLAADLTSYRRSAVGLTIPQTVALVGDVRRGEYLHAWLRHRGAAAPADAARPVRAPRNTDQPPTPAQVRADDPPVFRHMGEIVRREYDAAHAAGRSVHAVQIGDWGSHDALCSAETIKQRAKERVVEDIEAAETALDAFHAGLGVAAVTSLPGLSCYLTLGNHDVRISKLADDQPWLDGLYVPGASHQARGWTVTPFLQPLRIDGFRYQHYLTSKGSGRAIGGVNHARTMAARVHYDESVVVGHSHYLQYHTERSHIGRRTHYIVSGCWLDHQEAYAGQDNESWWSGHIVMRGVAHGDFEVIEFHARK